MNTADQPPPLHIAVFPWLAFGHMIPVLELSKSLAKRGHQISYISTPRNISRLPKLPPNLSSLIHFIPVTLPKVPGLPDNAEATSDVPPEKVQFLKLALDGLQQPFANFLKEYSSSKLKGKLPDWIILDFATPWAASLASQFSIPCIFFSVYNATGLTFLGPENELTPDGSRTTPEHFTVPPNWIPFPSNLAYSLHGATLLVNNVYSLNASGMTDICLLASTLRACKLVAPRSCMELESEYLNLLQNLYNKPVIPVGLLQPSSSSSNTKTRDVKNDPILQWLDKQEPKSVVYIAFGSEATLSIELLHELALGLEMSEFHFLWALRKPADFEGEVLPEGFEERTKERGVVTLGWVPQLDVLGHVSVGGFLTHSGWSSVIEALQFGHPLVLLPIFADQDINARMVEHRGFGVEVKRKQDGYFDREAVASALRLVMLDDDDDDGMKVRVKAKELSVIFADKERQEQYVDDFLQHLRDYTEQHV